MTSPAMKKVGEKMSYDPEKRLGDGGFAFVYEGLFGGLKVAVKRIQREHLNDSLIERETEIMRLASNQPNILGYFGYEKDDPYNFMYVLSFIIYHIIKNIMSYTKLVSFYC